MQACLEAMAPTGLGPEGTAASSLWKAAELVVQAVCSTPAPLRPALADAVLLQPFKQVTMLHICSESRVCVEQLAGQHHLQPVAAIVHAACSGLFEHFKSSCSRSDCLGVLLGVLPWPPCCTHLHHSSCVLPCMQP